MNHSRVRLIAPLFLLAVAPASFAENYQGLWWKSPAHSESGWGLELAHQGDVLFATWFTYDANGQPLWLAMSNGVKTGAGAYAGTLFRTSGPVFYAPWDDAATSTPVGSASLTFTGRNDGTFTYTVDGVTQSKPITRYVVSSTPVSCTAGGTPGAQANYTDLWWGSPPGRDAGWGVGLTHQGDILIATWFSHGVGKQQWIVMSHGVRTGDNTYSGTLYRTTGPRFDAMPWRPAEVTTSAVGTATFTFADSSNATFAFTLDGFAYEHLITRYVFASPATVCR